MSDAREARSRARRVVSLVPSLTEALFALGLGPRVVGVTDWCIHPAAQVARVPKVGGTKNPSLQRIRELRPDLVIANQEEIERGTVNVKDLRHRTQETVARDGLAEFVVKKLAALSTIS